MKYIKSFRKINESGEWNRTIDWEYVKNNPDCDDDECQIIKKLEQNMEDIIEHIPDPSKFVLKDIRGFDMYQGAYAIVEIYGKKYKIWHNDDYNFFIENFPMSNTTEDEKPGFLGDIFEISDLIENYEIYQKGKKYNVL